MEKTAQSRVVEMDKAIKRVVNRKYSKTQPVEKPLVPEDKWLDEYYSALRRLIEAVYNVLFIVPAIVMGILEGISHGFLKGLQRATSAYEKRVKG